jgi:dTDP-glucose pyrophosphorylase
MMENTLINIVIPMAGLGSRFVHAGYKTPKPFIDISGQPMIKRVLSNLYCNDAKYILIARKEHMDKEASLVKEIEENYGAIFVPIDDLTEGTASTVLFARKYINNDNPLLIANSDQIVDIDINEFISDCQSRRLDGSILTFIDDKKDSKWSFVKVNTDGIVTEVREKKAISNIATVGIYMYSKGCYFVDAALDMIINNDRVNGEFYTCPSYNYAIKNGKEIGIFDVSKDKMHGLGTPEDLYSYSKSEYI